MKLLTIGDSISQGFMSGAAARTDQCYSTLLAEILADKKYNYPTWPMDGLPVNIESIFRRLEKRFGSDIKGIIEWPLAVNSINNYLDDVEDYYERGDGGIDKPFKNNIYNNLSVRGFDAASPWLIKPTLCREHIEKSPNKKDNWFGVVDESLLRTAQKVLEGDNKKSSPKDFTQLDWLQCHHKNEGVENLILWLGANNALGTVLNLSIKQTSNDGQRFNGGPEKVLFEERLKEDWNLWHPEDFRKEYEYTLNKVFDILQDNPKAIDYKVFVATIPLVTICPLIKAVGEQSDRIDTEVIEWEVNPNNPAPMSSADLSEPEKHTYSYGKYYPYFAFADSFELSLPHLKYNDVLHIDNCIRKYNRIIQETVATLNQKMGKPTFYLVDIGSALSKMAVKRNNYMPTYEFPEYFKYAYPKVDTKFFSTNRKGDITAGGIFSLDGVHPTAIGQGLIAYEFLKVFEKAGSFNGNIDDAFDWHKIFKSDTLYSQPISLLSEIYDNIEFKKWLIEKLTNKNGYRSGV